MNAAKTFFFRTADLWLAVSVAAAGIYFFSGHFTTVRFDRERIEVQVESGQLRVKGLYHYTNASWLPTVLTLRIPFPVDSGHAFPSAFSLSAAGEDGKALATLLPWFAGRTSVCAWPSGLTKRSGFALIMPSGPPRPTAATS